MSEMNGAATIIKAILGGAADDNLRGVFAAVQERQKVQRDGKATMMRLTLKPGDRAKIVGGIRPQTLIGLVVENVVFRWIETHTVRKWGMVR